MGRTARMLALLLMGCLVLTGCVRNDADLYIDANGRISGDVFLGVDPNAVPEPQRSQLRDVIEQKIETLTWPEGVAARYVQRGGYTGAQLTFQDVPDADYQASVEQAYRAAGISGSAYPTFTQRDDIYDMTWHPRIESTRPSEVNAKVTFPGDVQQSNGSVPRGKRNTVAWDAESARGLPVLEASGSAIPNGALLKPFNTLVRGLVFLALLAAAGLLLWVVWWNVKRRRTTAAPRT